MFNPIMKPNRQSTLDAQGRQYNAARNQETRYALYNPVRTGLRTREAYDLNGTAPAMTPTDWLKVGLVASVVAATLTVIKRGRFF